MLMAILLGPYIDRFGLAVAMLISNLLSVVLLQWVVTPVLRIAARPLASGKWAVRKGGHLCWPSPDLALADWYDAAVPCSDGTSPVSRGIAFHPGGSGKHESTSPPIFWIHRAAGRQPGSRCGWQSGTLRLARSRVPGVTNADGRITDLGPGPTGGSELTGSKSMPVPITVRCNRSPSYTSVCPVLLCLADPGQHYHVPLLLSPFAVSSYRGS